MTVILDVASTSFAGARTAHRVRPTPAPRPQLRELGRWVVTAAVVLEALAVTIVVSAGHGLRMHALNRPLDRTGMLTEMLVLSGVVVIIAGRLLLLAALTPKRPDSGLIATCAKLIRIARGTQTEQ